MGSTGACCAKLILGLLNTLFLLVGLALVAAGAMVLAGADFIASVLKSFKDIPVVSDYITIAAWVLVGIGIFLVVMGILGGCGACCAIKVFLIAYAVIVIILILIEVTFVALLFSDTLKDLLSDPVTKEFKKYKSIANKPKDPTSRAMDLLFINLKCCGWSDSNDIPGTEDLPTCCKGFSEELLNSGNPVVIGNINACQRDRTHPDFYNKGCYQAVLDLIDDNKSMVIGVGVALLVFQILCVVFAIWIVKDSSKISPVD